MDVTLNGNDYSADGSASRDMLNGGHRTWFIPCLADFLVEMGNVNTARDDAEDARDLAQSYAAALSGTSSTSLTVGTGGTSLTASTARQWVVGQHVYIARTSAPTTWMAGQVISYNAGTGALNVDVTASSGSGTYTDWTISIGGAQGATGSINSLVETTKTSGYTLVSGDKGKLVRVSGAFTLAFTSAATLASGWWCYVHNVGTGVVTLDPSSTQQIDGLTTYPMYPGEARLIWCTGSALRSIVLAPFRHVYTASGTFIDPPGYSMLNVRGWGAGGGGGKTGSSTTISGGSGGGCMDHQYAPTPGTSRTVTIGAGGAAVTTAVNGNDGGATEFGALFSWPGGLGGLSGSASRGGHAIALGSIRPVGAYEGGVGSDAAMPVWGGGGGGNGTAADTYGGRSSVYGGGSGGGGSSDAGVRVAGSSVYGGGGGAGGDATDGAAGSAPGGGGGSTRTGSTSGAGARGELQIWGVC